MKEKEAEIKGKLQKIFEYTVVARVKDPKGNLAISRGSSTRGWTAANSRNAQKRSRNIIDEL